MTENEILAAFRKSLKVGDRVRHKADWEAGTVLGKGHPAYETDVKFDNDLEPHGIYLRNLVPEWWPAPDWVKKESVC